MVARSEVLLSVVPSLQHSCLLKCVLKDLLRKYRTIGLTHPLANMRQTAAETK